MAETPRVLVADPLGHRGLSLLRDELDVVVTDDAGALHEHLPDAQALVVRSRTQVTDRLLHHGQRLRLVARAGIGVDNIDISSASERGILVINAPLGNVRSTAEHTIGLIFALARRIVISDSAVRTGRWKAGYEGMQLAGKRLGIIGLGQVGKQVAMLASAIGMEVLACDPYLPDTAWISIPVRRSDARELLSTSDVVSLHTILTEETRNLIGETELSCMKRGAYLVNCARGGLVDEAALARSLSEGQLAGAALDVFEQEPLLDSPLLSAPKLILTPHVAASTREAQDQVSADIAQQVVDFFAGRPVAYPINPSVLREA